MAYPTATLEEVWALFKETDRKFQETAQEIRQLSQETDRKFQESIQETNRKFQETTQETNRKFQETTQEIRQLSQETDLKFNETDRKFQETDRRFKETDRLIRELSKKMDGTRAEIGRLGNRLGDFVEGLIKPSLVQLFQHRGIIVHKVYHNVEANNGELKLATQIDLLAVNHEICVLVEVKSRLSIDDVNEHLERMEKFKPLFPEYQDKQVLGAVAGMVIPEDVAKYAYRKGFYIIGQRGDNAVILNDDKFKPAAW